MTIVRNLLGDYIWNNGHPQMPAFSNILQILTSVFGKGRLLSDTQGTVDAQFLQHGGGGGDSV
jgi:hypothetical protein